MILGFAHPALVVRDLEGMRDFYERAFGFRLLSEEGWAGAPAVDAAIGSQDSRCRGYMLAGHNCFLELFVFEQPASAGPDPAVLPVQAPGLRHLSFYVDDVEQEYARLIALGAQPLGTPQKSAGIGAVYLRDPEGNIIELAEFASPAERLTELPGISGLQGEENV